MIFLDVYRFLWEEKFQITLPPPHQPFKVRSKLIQLTANIQTSPTIINSRSIQKSSPTPIHPLGNIQIFIFIHIYIHASSCYHHRSDLTIQSTVSKGFVMVSRIGWFDLWNEFITQCYGIDRGGGYYYITLPTSWQNKHRTSLFDESTIILYTLMLLK